LQKLSKIITLVHHAKKGGEMGKSFGEFLRALRESRNLTLRQVEERVRVSNAYLSQIERGERGIPNLKILNKLAEVYGVSVEELATAAKQETDGKSVTAEISAPDVAFVSRGYERLSRENKEHLTEFLQFLLHKEQKKSRSADE
jgi:transcriptional regulator with XRE-family HTH domain